MINHIRGWMDLVEAKAPQTRYRFVTTCENTDLNGSHGEAIYDMRRATHGILDYRDILRLIGAEQLQAANLDPKGIKTDFAVSWEASTWRGLPCIYIVQSGIEHIFTPNGETPCAWVDEDEE